MSRLEEIKARKHLLESNGYDLSYTNEDIDWLIEQAERVQELEKTNKNNYWIAADFKFENLKLEEQNKRYREALEFYAVSGQGIGEEKHGEVARKALEGESSE